MSYWLNAVDSIGGRTGRSALRGKGRALALSHFLLHPFPSSPSPLFAPGQTSWLGQEGLPQQETQLWATSTGNKHFSESEKQGQQACPLETGPQDLGFLDVVNHREERLEAVDPPIMCSRHEGKKTRWASVLRSKGLKCMEMRWWLDGFLHQGHKVTEFDVDSEARSRRTLEGPLGLCFLRFRREKIYSHTMKNFGIFALFFKKNSLVQKY